MTEIDIFKKAFGNNLDAASFCLDILYISHLWDDLIDKDKIRTDDEINKAFEILLLSIPVNPFFRQYEDSIRPMLHVAIITWYESNKRQNGNQDDKFYAFFLRNAILNVVYFSCALVDGDNKILHDYFSERMKNEYEDFIKEDQNG